MRVAFSTILKRSQMVFTGQRQLDARPRLSEMNSCEYENNLVSVGSATNQASGVEGALPEGNKLHVHFFVRSRGWRRQPQERERGPKNVGYHTEIQLLKRGWFNRNPAHAG